MDFNENKFMDSLNAFIILSVIYINLTNQYYKKYQQENIIQNQDNLYLKYIVKNSYTNVKNRIIENLKEIIMGEYYVQS